MIEVVELDEEQQCIVDSDDSMIVISGPGSGKTRVLTEKARRLLHQNKLIVCLCFTKSAAREMARRVPGLPATTIHSYCCQSIGWKVPKGALSEEEGYDYLLTRFNWEMKDCMSKLDNILLDECQDVSPEELGIVLSIVGDKIFAVGDPYQSIYGFQGALGMDTVGILKKMGCTEKHLKNNYRSCEEVVSRLNSVYPRDLVSKNVKDIGTSAILCRKNQDVFFVSKKLKEASIPHRIRVSQEGSSSKEFDVIDRSNLRLMTVHCSKGLEFDNVYLFDWFPSNSGEELRVYYVAMSRASKTFTEVKSFPELLRELRKGVLIKQEDVTGEPCRCSLPVTSPSSVLQGA